MSTAFLLWFQKKVLTYHKTGHTPAGLGSQVSCPRAIAHLAGGRRVRGTPLICIYAVAGAGREITVRNVVFGELRLTRRARPTWLGGTPRPTVFASLHDFPMATLFRSNTTDEFLGDQGTYCNINRIFIDA